MNAVLTGSRAKTPDLDWSQVRETFLMIQLAVGQIEAAMRDGNNSVDVLTRSFTSMAGYIKDMNEGCVGLPDTPEFEQLKTRLESDARTLTRMVQSAIIAFQFYDKLVQRLSHVSQGLEGLGRVVCDPQSLYNPAEWAALQALIRARYSTQEEVDLFEEVMRGTPVAQALQKFTQKEVAVSEVELF